MTSGILLVDKPQGVTSHDVVARARRALGTRKVGHAGTLDPMATGLLVLGVDSSTRLLTYLVGLGKEYTATIRLGASTTTDDAEGEHVGGADASEVPRAEIDRGIAALTGVISQVPSTYSAIKVDGRRSYDLARSGAPGRARGAHQSRSRPSRCSPSAARGRSSTSTCGSNARRAPTSGRSPATSARASWSTGTRSAVT